MSMFGTHVLFEFAEGLQDGHEGGNTSQFVIGSPRQVGEEGYAVQLRDQFSLV